MSSLKHSALAALAAATMSHATPTTLPHSSPDTTKQIAQTMGIDPVVTLPGSPPASIDGLRHLRTATVSGATRGGEDVIIDYYVDPDQNILYSVFTSGDGGSNDNHFSMSNVLAYPNLSKIYREGLSSSLFKIQTQNGEKRGRAHKYYDSISDLQDQSTPKLTISVGPDHVASITFDQLSDHLIGNDHPAAGYRYNTQTSWTQGTDPSSYSTPEIQVPDSNNDGYLSHTEIQDAISAQSAGVLGSIYETPSSFVGHPINPSITSTENPRTTNTTASSISGTGYVSLMVDHDNDPSTPQVETFDRVKVVKEEVINQAPIAINDSYTWSVGQTTATFDPTTNDTDPENGPLQLVPNQTFDVVPAVGTVTQSGNNLSFTLTDTTHKGPINIQYDIQDNQGLTDTGEITIHVPNTPPTLSDGSYSMESNSSLTIPLQATDTNNDTITYTIANIENDIPSATVTLVGDQIQINIGQISQESTITVTIIPHDGTDAGEPATYTIDVTKKIDLGTNDINQDKQELRVAYDSLTESLIIDSSMDLKSLELYNMIGQKIGNFSVTQERNGRYVVNLTGHSQRLKPGVHLVKASDKNGNSIHYKFMIK